VSVVICVYNAGVYFRPSLLSILGQTYDHLDILIIDDGSTDGCVEGVQDLLSDPRVRLFRQANAGKSAALNRALDEARGLFYAVHDADDISHPRRVEVQLRALLERPDVAAVFCGHEIIFEGRTMAPIEAARSEAECSRAIAAFRQPAHDPTAFYRMSSVDSLRYDTTLQCCEGLDYILRVGERHSMLVVGECLYGYRILPTSLTRRDPAWRQGFVAVALQRACGRRGLDYAALFPNGPPGPRRSRRSSQDNNLAANFIVSVLSQRQHGRWWDALTTGLLCARLQPLDFQYYKALIYALLPAPAIRLLRRRGERSRA
jgi:glycosyltransferase involved in cell wall biosynthesis